MKNIIIFAEPRTGSNLLCEVFHQYTSVKVFYEFFINFVDKKDIPHYTTMSEFERNFFAKCAGIPNDITSFITFLRAYPYRSLMLLDAIFKKYKIIKIHDFIFDNLNMEFLLDDPETKFILLNRTSKIKQYISNQQADYLKQWHHADTSNIKITVDAEKFLKFKQASVEWYSRIENLLIEKNHNFLRVNYEEDLENIDQDLLTSKINNWLESNGISSATNDYKLNFFKKQNLASPEETITNYQEIQHLI